MGLITRYVKVKWHGNNKKHYEELGYIFTKIGDEFKIKVEDLPKGSHIKVDCECDGCGKKLNIIYKNYNKTKKEEGETYCKDCASKFYGGENIRRKHLENGKSFEQWCIENNRQDILDRWDYKLNDCSPSEVNYCSNNCYWFKCLLNNKHCSEYKSLNRIINGAEGYKQCKQCKSIGQYIVDNFGEDFLWEVWSDKNEKSPFEYSMGSKVKVWWKCKEGKHEDYLRSCDGGKHYSFRCRKCIKHPSGEEHPNWNPNLTQEERELGRQLEGYNTFVKEVFKRDSYTCQCCGQHGGILNAHHLNGYNWDKKHRMDINNAITLCDGCHKKFHKIYGYGNNSKEQFKEFISNNKLPIELQIIRQPKLTKGRLKGDNSNAKPVYCYEFDEIRLYGKEWAEELSISYSSMMKKIKENKPCKGYHFRYATEEEIEEYKLKHKLDK